MNSQNTRQLGVFFILLTFGVVGRWLQPEWHFTPIVAIALFSGYFFSNRIAALLAPIAVVTVSNLILPAYTEMHVMAVVYLSFLIPVMLGWWLQKKVTYGRLAVAGLLPALLFFLTTNLAVWFWQPEYALTLAGLIECYVVALPFLKWWVLGDVFYLTLMFGSYFWAVESGVLRVAPVVCRKEPTE